ncbi:glutathione-dependent formaldehyde-activating enzyme [Diaporthe amygdali]|uniref:glutathione-dependent formaldehyde-activating enzyme n=1 Tax=Phomopsis amygdali TaxID=1214568 RepID=UPI0022FE4E81|nr:glutathione-dependent formaldehyde-activating enzyme [Diaporthe amygdali]KAJ0117387.1 glutathione-dependent formaldehyde-activating enzyme [Diaporthe amygdali]
MIRPQILVLVITVYWQGPSDCVVTFIISSKMQLKLCTILCSLATGITAAHVRREGGGEQASTSASTCSDITKTVTAIATISYGVTRTTTVTVVKTETDEVTKTDTVTTVKPGPTQTVSSYMCYFKAKLLYLDEYRYLL